MFFFVSIFILFIFTASACSSVCVCVCNTVVSIYSAYCLLLFYGLCCCAYGDNEKQNLLNICICYACVFVCVEKGKMLLWKNDISNERKTSNAKYYIILFCYRPMLLICLRFTKGVWILCTLSLFVCFFRLHLHITISVFVCIRRRIFPDYFICVCIGMF